MRDRLERVLEDSSFLEELQNGLEKIGGLGFIYLY